jgi:hypothetical protein
LSAQELLILFENLCKPASREEEKKSTGEKFGAYDFLRAIVLNGEASEAEMDEMRNIIREVLR